MGKQLAFLFPGQGSQAVGMGRTFYEGSTVAREVYQESDERLGRHLTRLMFEGPEEALKQTQNSQLAIYVTSMAILRVLQEQFPAVKPAVCAGHSLGEYSALCAGGWLEFAEGLQTVVLRASLMNEACRRHSGAMAALLGIDEEGVTRLVARVGEGLWAANFNCPGQIVISGRMAAVEQALALAKEFGARKAILLPVQGAFHSGLMREAAEQFAPHVQHLVLAESGVPLVPNATAERTASREVIRSALARQIISPVRWQQSVEQMRDMTLFVEIGGSVLAGFNRKIGVVVPTVAIEKIADLEQFAKEIAT